MRDVLLAPEAHAAAAAMAATDVDLGAIGEHQTGRLRAGATLLDGDDGD
jgi:hypothetical protein